MYTPLPTSSDAFAQATWDDIEPWYQELAATSLAPETVQPWLAQWSRLSALMDEAMTWLDIACTQDTTDDERTRRKQRFADTIYRPAQPHEQRLKERLLASGLEPDGFATPLRNLRAEAALFREANLPLLQEEQTLIDDYARLGGAQTVTWDGEEVGVAAVRRVVVHEPQRPRREMAWRAMTERQLADREALQALWVKGLQVRQQIARNAGCASYRDYRWQQLFRFDYTPGDCQAFHAAVERVVVPASRHLWERRRQALGVDTVRPWDAGVDPRGGTTPQVFSDGAATLQRCALVFGCIDPHLRDYFTTMLREQLCDLDPRPGKARMGYNRHLEARRRPFIFGDVQTIEDVVSTVFHEAGHAFHVFEMHRLPYLQQRQERFLPLEFAEVASTTMELLGAMHLQEVGLCTPREEVQARVQHLERFVLQLFPLAARGDAFQHWVYEDPERAMDFDACSQRWIELSARFLPDVDWTDLEVEQRAEWQQVRHFFGWPFYYIEYALAALGALQVWDHYLADPRRALRQFRAALALGATRPVPDLFAAAGVTFSLESSTLKRVVKVVTDALGQLDAPPPAQSPHSSGAEQRATSAGSHRRAARSRMRT